MCFRVRGFDCGHDAVFSINTPHKCKCDKFVILNSNPNIKLPCTNIISTKKVRDTMLDLKPDTLVLCSQCFDNGSMLELYKELEIKPGCIVLSNCSEALLDENDQIRKWSDEEFQEWLVGSLEEGLYLVMPDMQEEEDEEGEEDEEEEGVEEEEKQVNVIIALEDDEKEEKGETVLASSGGTSSVIISK